MKKSIVIIKKNTFIYNGEEYDFDSINDMSSMLKSNIKIIILEEDLYVKQFTSSLKGSKIHEFINFKVENNFLQNGDILYDFQKNKSVIAIYSMKGARRVEKLADIAKNIEVRPIQFIVKDIMNKILKDNLFSCKVLIKFDEYYYYISFKEGFFYYGFIEKNEEIVSDKIISNNNFGDIYIDSTIIDIRLTDKFTVIKINMGELIDDKIYEKQRIYSRKIL